MMFPPINVPLTERPPHADISEPDIAPAHLVPWLNHMSTITSGLMFSTGKSVSSLQMLKLNSKKTDDIIDYVPETPDDPGPNANTNARTWHSHAMAAYTHDIQTLAALNNTLLQHMGSNDAAAIRLFHPDGVTTRQIMQYLEDAYGTLGPTHLEHINRVLLVWNPRLPSRLNLLNLNQYWDILQFNDSNRFMSLGKILNSHPTAYGHYRSFTEKNPLSTDFAALSTFLNQRLPMGTETGQIGEPLINYVEAQPPTPQALMTQFMMGFETLQQQNIELAQRFADIQQVAAPPRAAPSRPLKQKYCFVHGMGHSGINCKWMNNPTSLASDGQPYSDGMKQARGPRATPATRNIAGKPK